MEFDWFTLFVLGWIGIGLGTLTFLVVSKIRAPYGRHTQEGWGIMIPNKLGWIIMEMPALLLTPIIALSGPNELDQYSLLLISLWVIHYSNRTIIFPLRIRTSGKKMPITIILSAIFFNSVNGFVNGYYLGYIYDGSMKDNMLSAHMILGLLLFFMGFYINNMADSKLISLRKNSTGYQIPRGWLFEYISCPNHFGEIIEWMGYAVLAWNLPAISFAVWTLSNLIPRTLNHHAWYNEHFEDYPKNRKAVIPKIL